MKIRKATYNDIEFIMEIFDKARNYMRENKNNIQWVNGYPSVQLIMDEIESGHCMVCIEDNRIAATFCIIYGNDPTYNYIEDGDWLNEEPYAVIHRLASDGSIRGVAEKCIKWCFTYYSNIRVDTHEVNNIMQEVLLRNKFQRCGIIYVTDGTPRIVFQKSTDR